MKKQQNKTLRIASVLLVLALVTTVALTGTLARYTATASADSQWARVAAFRVLVNDKDISYYTGANKLAFGLGDLLMDDARVEQCAEGNNLYEVLDVTSTPTGAEACGVTGCTDCTALAVGETLGALVVDDTKAWTTAVDADDWENAIGGETPAAFTDGFLLTPGEGGSAKLKVQNLSEVPVKVAFAADSTTSKVTTGMTNLKLLVTDLATHADLQAAEADTSASWASLSDLLSGANIGTTLAPAADTDLVLYWKWDFAADGSQDTWDTALGSATADWLYGQTATEINALTAAQVATDLVTAAAATEVADADGIADSLADALDDTKPVVAGFFLDDFVLTVTQVD